MNELFRKFSQATSQLVGSSGAFILAVALIVVWGLTGPLFHYSDTWQLVVNTATTIVTFLMVFLIQNSQNRDAAAMQAKLDELIRAIETGRNQFIGIEHLTDQQIQKIRSDLEAECTEDDRPHVTAAVDRLLRRL